MIPLMIAIIGCIPIALAIGFFSIYGRSKITFAIFTHMLLIGVWQMDIVILYLASYRLNETVAIILFKFFRGGSIFAVPIVFHLTYFLLKEKLDDPNSFKIKTFSKLFKKWNIVCMYFLAIFVYITNWTSYGVTGLTSKYLESADIRFYYPTYGPLNVVFKINLFLYMAAILSVCLVMRNLLNRNLKQFITLFGYASIIVFAIGVLNIFPQTNLIMSNLAVLIYSLIIGGAFMRMYTQLMIDHQKMTEKQNRMNHVGAMTSSLIHEIKNSITIIKGYSELLPRIENMSEKGKSLNEHVLTASIQLNNLVTSFSDFIKSDTMNLKFDMYKVNDLMNTVLKLSKEKIEKYGVDLKIIMENDNLNVQMDISHMTQVLLNLVINSIEAMENTIERKLTINFYIDREDNVIFRVKDTGEGIPLDQRKTIFNVFHTTKETGTGIGLAYCNNIIMLHSGSIEVLDHNGKGALIEVKFPRYNMSNMIVEGV